jgi:hypothetical protein
MGSTSRPANPCNGSVEPSHALLYRLDVLNLPMTGDSPPARGCPYRRVLCARTASESGAFLGDWGGVKRRPRSKRMGVESAANNR